ncbi:MAG: hypothetical protein ABID09_02960, partial [Candidatus Omnitrophota bacterium]
RSALDQSWTGTQAVDSYQAPLGSSTQEGSFQQGLAQGSPPGNMVNGGPGGPDGFNNLGPADTLTFAEVNNTPATPGVTTFYARTLGINPSSDFLGGSMNVKLKLDGTWTGEIVSGVYDTEYPPTQYWSTSFQKSSPADVVDLINGSPTFSVGGPWSADEVSGTITGTITDTGQSKQLSGTASGDYCSEGTFTGTASGTWENSGG